MIKVIENPNNPRTIKGEKYKKLVRSIIEFPKMMAIRPIVYDPKTGFVLGGNMRLKAAKEAIRALGMKDLPDNWFLSADTLTTQEEMDRFIITDNVSFGEWDWEKLANEWDTDLLDHIGMDVPDAYKKGPEAKEDDYEAPFIIETDIQIGDLFEIGPHRLLCGDALDPEHWKKLMAGEKADLVLTDPPYNVAYVGKRDDEMTINNDRQSDLQFFNFLKRAFSLMAEHTKEGGAWYIWHADSEGINFRTAIRDAGIDTKQCLIWVKNSMVLGRQDYQWRHEPCIYGWKPGAGHYFVNDRTLTTIIEQELDFNKMKREDLVKLLELLFSELPNTAMHCKRRIRNDLHPTMKPVLLFAPLIENSTQGGEIVQDGFIGAGSTMVACHQLLRRCYGMDNDPTYCQRTLDRMIQLDPEIEIKKNGKPYKTE